jgi:hypothetical protein
LQTSLPPVVFHCDWLVIGWLIHQTFDLDGGTILFLFLFFSPCFQLNGKQISIGFCRQQEVLKACQKRFLSP